jgi:bifunctional DNA-binding transcriptional regulator/antitoxin component of YhaV-PrlF toxin-antitoxin module
MPRLLSKSKVWGRGYTTVPVTVRRVLDLRNGDEIGWYMGSNGEIIIKKVGGRNE